jgi:hypothetical protein
MIKCSQMCTKHANVFANSKVFSADACLVGGHVLREKPSVDKEKYIKFRVGTRKPMVSCKEGQTFKPL